MPINNGIINQKGTPAFYSDIFANRPAFGYAGRVFISTDTGAIYEDTGSAWTLIADAGAGTTGTLQQVTTNGNTTTLGIVVDGININNGAGTGSQNTAIGTDALFSNTTGNSNTGIGFQSLPLNTTGSNNTGLGLQSLNVNTTGGNNVAIGVSALNGNTTASNNTAIGYRSLFANTGAQNTAIGSSALTSNTTGDGNVAVGYLSSATNTTGVNNSSLGLSSLRLNTTGSNNTAIGSIALQNNTTGASNTAVGYASLTANTTGASNTAVGIESLITNTTGNNNVAVGNQSLSANTTGASNTAVGIQSLYLNTTGTGNTALGSSALISSTTASSNTAVGISALTNATTGGQNTAIGINAGSNITTGTNNSFVGISAGVGITTGSNNTILGNAGTLSAALTSNIILADGGGNTRLFSDANGLIAINQAVGSVPGGQLDIHSTQTYALVLNGLSTSNAYTAFSNANVGKWRIGNTYNAGANTFDIFNLGTSSNALSFNATTNNATFSNNVGLGTSTAAKLTLLQGADSLSNGFRIYRSNGTDYQELYMTSGFGSFNDPLNFYSSSIAGVVAAIDRDGKAYFKSDVGIATTTIGGSKFQVNGSAAIGYSASTAAPSNGLVISGTTLIGSTTDDTINKLQVTGSGIFSSSGTTQIRIKGVGSATGFDLQNDSSGCYIVNRDASSMYFFTSNLQAMNIKSTRIINLSNVPNSSVGLVSGDLYQTAGALMIVP